MFKDLDFVHNKHVLKTKKTSFVWTVSETSLVLMVERGPDTNKSARVRPCVCARARVLYVNF